MKDTAIHVLDRLANGVHPMTGEIFAADSPYNDPTVIRSLFFALQHLQHATLDKRRKHHERAWTLDQQQFVADAYREGASLIYIGKTLKRSRSSIRSELVRQGLLAQATYGDSDDQEIL